MDLNPELIDRLSAETEMALARARKPDAKPGWWESWKVDVPTVERDGVLIDRFTITEHDESVDRLRAALNPQRADRSVRAGTYSRLTVDGSLWMTDTPAECADLRGVDVELRGATSALIVGLGLGVVLNRAIVTHGVPRIDVVEVEPRVIEAVGPHYRGLAEARDLDLTIHEADVHRWRPGRWVWWDVGFFDIWAHIDSGDLPEVTRLRRRFRNRLGWFGAWAQTERLAQQRRTRTGLWAY